MHISSPFKLWNQKNVMGLILIFAFTKTKESSSKSAPQGSWRSISSLSKDHTFNLFFGFVNSHHIISSPFFTTFWSHYSFKFQHRHCFYFFLCIAHSCLLTSECCFSFTIKVLICFLISPLTFPQPISVWHLMLSWKYFFKVCQSSLLYLQF